MRKALFLFVSLSLSLAALAGKPKITPGLEPGIGDNDGNTTGGGNNTEVTLPVGLPAGDDFISSESSDATATANIVYTFDISPEDRAASANQTHAALTKAKDMNAACVLIRIEGFAGGWDVAENIRQEIISYDRPVMVYVNNQTIPAANFISLGADSIYTKKGSTISNKKGSVAKTVETKTTSKKESASVVVATASDSKTVNPDALYNDEATTSEILYKAGLGNLTVVEHQAGISERIIDFMMNPFIVMAILLLIGFVMRKTAKGKLPGPIMYLLVLSLMLYLVPFQLSGLANGIEILVSLALTIAVIVSARSEKRYLTGILLIALTIAFSLVRAGDTEAILRYGTFSDILTLPSIPLLLVILGWWIAKYGEGRKVASRLTAPSPNSVSLVRAA